MGLFRVIIYGIILGVYAGSLFYDIRFVPRFGHKWWISKLVMLTMINFVLQTVYSAICFICSLFDWNEEIIHARKHKQRAAHVLPSYWRQTKLHRLCDFMYSTSVFPVGMATCLLFWSLYVVEPTLVLPTVVAKAIPQWLNHVTHTAPIGFILIDTLLTCHHAPSRKVGTAVVALLYVIYLAIIFGTYFTEGYWLYPIFDRLSKQHIAILLAAGGTLFWALYLIGDGMNAMLWGTAHSAAPRDQKLQQKQK